MTGVEEVEDMTEVENATEVENMTGVEDMKNDVRKEDEDGKKNLIKHSSNQGTPWPGHRTLFSKQFHLQRGSLYLDQKQLIFPS
jgi:hypothetical protein